MATRKPLVMVAGVQQELASADTFDVPAHNQAQSTSHDSPDTDSATTALHHTLGTGAAQAAAGNDTRLSNERVPTADGLAGKIHAAESVTPLVDADAIGFRRSILSDYAKITYANLKSTLKTYFDTVYAAISHAATAHAYTGSSVVVGTTSDYPTDTYDKHLFHFDDNVTDVGSSTCTATAYGTPTYTAVTGFGSALTLNGTDQYVDSADTVSLAAYDFSIALRFNLTSLPSPYGILLAYHAMPNDTTAQALLNVNADGSLYLSCYDSSGHGATTSAGVVTTGVWYTAIITRVGQTVTLYLGTTGTASSVASVSLASAGASLVAGAYSTFVGRWSYIANPAYTSCQIDELKVRIGATQTTTVPTSPYGVTAIGEHSWTAAGRAILAAASYAAQFALMGTGRTITCTSPLTIGGTTSADLSADRTLAIPAATASAPGHATAAQITKLDGIAAGANVGIPPPATPEQGDVLYYDGSAWARLVHGTSGQYLKTQGHSANPVWDAPAGGGVTPSYLFGDGSDGDVTISGAVSLTRDMYYDDLTIAAGAALNPANFIIRVKGTLDLTATPAGGIVANGITGSNVGDTASAGAAKNGVLAQTIGARGAGAIGGAGAVNAGSGGGNPALSSFTRPTTNSGNSGSGGASAAAGGSYASGTSDATPALTHLAPSLLLSVSNGFYYMGGGYGGSGGGGGSGDGSSVSGGGGGGGGTGAGCIAIYAKTIARGTNATAGIIAAIGGTGGYGGSRSSSNTGGGGGGGGAGGGTLYLVFWERTGSAITGAVDVSSGAGGAGGTKTGTGNDGVGGGAGQGGRTTYIDLQAGTVTTTVGAAATTYSGSRTGVAANTTQVDL